MSRPHGCQSETLTVESGLLEQQTTNRMLSHDTAATLGVRWDGYRVRGYDDTGLPEHSGNRQLEMHAYFTAVAYSQSDIW